VKNLGLIERIKAHVHASGHIMMTATFVFGFILDFVALPRIDQPATQYLAFVYFIVGFLCIIVHFRLSVVNLSRSSGTIFYLTSLYVSQFVLGGLASMIFVYYFRSSSISASWPILVFLFSLMVVPEFLKEKFVQFEFRSLFFYILFLFFMIFFVPMVVGGISVWVFVVSLLMSLLGLSIFLSVCCIFLREYAYRPSVVIFQISFLFTCGVGALYMAHVIPAIPLVLNRGEVAHYVVKADGTSYLIEKEEQNIVRTFFLPTVYHYKKGEGVYFYSAVFSPAKFNTSIVHEWQMLDRSGDWQTVTYVPFPIVGGNSTGYRGYSMKSSLVDGKWRVNVRTLNGRIIGRTYFVAKETTEDHLIVGQKR
jgi:hypothetical protein